MPFFKEYKYYIQVEVTASNAEDFNAWFGYVESQIRKLVPIMEANHAITTHLAGEVLRAGGRGARA